MRIAVPDLVSNSYFPAVAAIELGFFKAQGMDVELEMIFPVGRAMEALRDGGVDFVAGPAHTTPLAFPGWEGAKLLTAVSQHTFWLLVLRSDLGTLRQSRACVSERHPVPTPRCADCWQKRVWTPCGTM